MSNTTDTEQDMSKHFYRASAEDFAKIPGSPIAYWVSDDIRQVFSGEDALNKFGHCCSGIQTGDNELYLRQWYEVENKLTSFTATSFAESLENNQYWLPHKKGGSFRKWYGNCDYVMNWAHNGHEILNNPSARPQNLDYMFSEGVTWSHTSSSSFSARHSSNTFTFNVEGPTYISSEVYKYLGLLCSKPVFYIMQLMNPTLHFLVGSVKMLPAINIDNISDDHVKNMVNTCKLDWDSYETSWDFRSSALLLKGGGGLESAYDLLRSNWQSMTDDMQRLEEGNNRIFIDAYGLQDELTPEVPIEEITLTCNPVYRYDAKKSFEELDALLLADTMKEFISYAVGCMFGRYSLDKPGLILANQGETLEDYITKVCEDPDSSVAKEDISFMPDDDNVIPITEGEYFTDDITVRFCEFLKVTFGEENFSENLAFIENAIGKKLRKYFVADFYTHHTKTYKKRPIYWMFSSPKKSFNALIYMHRYQPDTVSVILNDYLREFQNKLTGQKKHNEQITVSATAPDREKRTAQKEIDKIDKILRELEEYERDVIYPLATDKLEIDLDDGVKVNYAKFGQALRKI